ncbi:MAG: dTDP-4-dehydrorhamnose reductase [Ignavibacteriales bacterium]|nr:dTDP-4-dehydrorhamnose reductase [Ignavibacteriales bacterium]
MSKIDTQKQKILIVGSNGMLGQRLIEHYLTDENTDLLCSSIEEKSLIENVNYFCADITDKKTIGKIIKEFKPDFIINAAAYTDVDRSETERVLAQKINVEGVANLANYSSVVNSHLIYISTDYVFDGIKGPYSEDDIPNPINYYGKTKLAGENAIKKYDTKHTILRTNVLFGLGKNVKSDFVKWFIESLRNNKPVQIVDDQINNPTYVDDLVDAIGRVIEYKKKGLFNIGGAEFLNRYEFALRIADFFGFDKSLITPVKTEVFNQPARRPLKSGLITLKAETELGYKPSSYEEIFIKIKKRMSV